MTRPASRCINFAVRSLVLLAAASIALALSGCAGPGAAPPPAAAAAGPREVLERFVASVERGRWEDAWQLLSARWRGRCTPAQLAADWKASGPVGPEAALRLRLLLAGGARLDVGPREATLALGPGRAARAVLEEIGWRVEAIE